MQIQIKTLTGRNIPVDVEPTDKIMRIKELMEEKEGIHPSQQKLIHLGNNLDDDLTVQEAKIDPGATLHVVLALRGGH
ncbi:hypothetical protein DIURU_002601 [Diutina rugosa]|uniref:Ubiquitin-like domain-containing protein n=1 Tax=Diutina rugosa TaxID=5481 RepID=A0A642UPH5_DIURU|nr:uncharacterized protein DIURU_002601 [Diutina rugosa]KAA8903000.1 hypothetical protein DIURU_002601 [Diutina rugosa]